MKKRIFLSIFFFLLFLGAFLGYCFYHSYHHIQIDSVTFLKYDGTKETMQIEIKKINSFFHKKFQCEAKDDKGNVLTSNGEQNHCLLDLSMNEHYLISIYEDEIRSKEFDSNNIKKKELSFQNDHLYLGIGEIVSIKSLLKEETETTFYSTNESIFKVDGSTIIGLEKGTAYLYSEDSVNQLTITVTDLVTKPTLLGENKPSLTCGIVSSEENDMLDEMLEQRIAKAGYQTRAGAIAAARFLTMQFRYKIAYFYENGRIHESGVNYADGEGRYYHKGLYLSEKKFDSLEAVYSGPSTWGCPLWNWEDEPAYGYYKGTKMPNGLDCSGFVSWVLKNAGFDPGDIGAGETEYPQQMTDLGEFVPLTDDLIYSNKIKVGDLFNIWGHISILVGMDEDHFYIAESLQNYGGVVVRTYTKENVKQWFSYVVLMDSYYKEDGNYTEIWNDQVL